MAIVKPHVLFIDDDPDDREILAEALAEAGLDWWLTTAPGGEAGLKFLNERRAGHDTLPELILLDLNMPGKDGREVLSIIKENKTILRCVPVIVFSTSNQPGDIRFSYRNCANSYITKPQDFETLIDLVKSIHQYWFEISRRPFQALNGGNNN